MQKLKKKHYCIFCRIPLVVSIMASSLTTYHSSPQRYGSIGQGQEKPAHLFLLLCRTLLYPHLEHCAQFLSLSPEESRGAREGEENNCKDQRASQAETEGPRTPQVRRENARQDMTQSYKSHSRQAEELSIT